MHNSPSPETNPFLPTLNSLVKINGHTSTTDITISTTKNNYNSCSTSGDERIIKNTKTLSVTFLLFFLLTLSQFTAAYIANSLALLADCASMLADSITYLLNLCAERSQNSTNGPRNELFSAGLSIMILVGIAIFVIYDSVKILSNPIEEETGTVEAPLVLAFGIAGLLVDFTSCTAFCVWSSDSFTHHKINTNDQLSRMNLQSAFLHVGADTLRSTTTVIESLLILCWDWKSVQTDSMAALIVSGIVLFGGLMATVRWIFLLMAFLKKDNDVDIGGGLAKTYGTFSDTDRPELGSPNVNAGVRRHI